MKKKSKILSIFFGTLLTSILIGTTSILTSCKNESDIDDNKPSTSIPEQSKPDLSTGPLTIKFINLDSLYDTVKDYILTTPRMYTAEEFVNDIKNNEQSVKELIANKLYISNKETLDVNKIKSISLNSDNQLEINLDSDNTKYEIQENQNVSIDANKLTIKNLEFYNGINVQNIDQLSASIQNYIDSNNLFSYEQLNSKLNDNNFKSQIATTIGIDSSKIANVSFDNNLLSIIPYSSVNNRNKFVSSTNIKNGSIQIEINNLIYCSEIKVSNLDNLQTSIINYINESNNKFTISEFESQLNSDNFKNRIATTIDTDKILIGNITYKDETLKIEPNLSINSNVEFSPTQSSSILVNGSLQLSIATSSFYTAISLNKETISNLRKEIINLINTDGVTKDLIDSYLPYEIKDLIDNIDTSNNQKLSNFVVTPIYSDNSIKIYLKNNIGKYKFTSYQSITNNISITNEVITLNNIQIPTNVTPQESPEDWFTWDSNGNQITGLSNVGLNQKRIVLPSKSTSITNDAFYNNKTLVSVDMSLSKITSIPNGIGNGVGTFKHCLNIISISLPPSLTSIGYGAFYNCDSLTSISIPDSVTSIGNYAFHKCNSLTSISIPDSVTSIGSYTFYNCNSLTSITLSNSLTSIPSYIFTRCTSLTSISIPDSVTSIGNYAFSDCASLTSIMMSNSVISIRNGVFKNVPSTCVMNVSSTWNQTLATNADYEGIFVID